MFFLIVDVLLTCCLLLFSDHVHCIEEAYYRRPYSNWRYNYNNWGGWGNCSVGCGNGTKYRYRTYNGDTQRFPTQSQGAGCTVHCWNNWNNWGGCSDTCATGVKRRYRHWKGNGNQKQQSATNVCHSK